MKDKEGSRRINRVLLVSPPGKVYVLPDGTPSSRKHCSPPLGLAYLAAVTRAAGYETQAVDMLAEGYEQEWYEEPFVYYGMNVHDLLKRIEDFQPQVVGFSVLFSFLAEQVMQLAAVVKDRFPGVHIVFGGHHPSALPEEIMRHHAFVDAVIIGEAEISFLKYLDHLNGCLSAADVPNLVYREQGRPVNTMVHLEPKQQGNGWRHFSPKQASLSMELDKLPRPAWDLLPMSAYVQTEVRIGGGDLSRQRMGVMMSSRGCPNICGFCLSPLVSGYRGYRRRSNESVLSEIRWLVNDLKMEEISFYDDNFFVNRNRVKELLTAIAGEFPNTLFNAVGGIEIKFMDDEMIDLMARANFYRALLAVESGNEEIQESMIDKRVPLDRVEQVVDSCRAKGIETRCLFMIGFPGETRAQIQSTLDLALRLNIDDLNISIVTPMPGTPLYDECLEKGLFLDSYSFNDTRFSAAKIRLPDTTPQELESLRREVWLQAFIERRRKMQSFVHDRLRRYQSIEEYEREGFRSKFPSRSEAPRA